MSDYFTEGKMPFSEGKTGCVSDSFLLWLLFLQLLPFLEWWWWIDRSDPLIVVRFYVKVVDGFTTQDIHGGDTVRGTFRNI